MATQIKEFREWLSQFDENDSIAVDDGGLAVVILTEDKGKSLSFSESTGMFELGGIPEDESAYVLQGLTSNGSTVYYTGRSGVAFVSHYAIEAFRYMTLEGATKKAEALNRMNGLTLVLFTAVMEGSGK